MQEFSSYFLLDTESAKRYAVNALGFFEPSGDLSCREIGDGNINYVFRLSSPSQGKSLILKQADRLLRSSGRPLDCSRSRIEYEALSLMGESCPGYVPKLYGYDETMHLCAMEDISEYKNLRLLLMEGVCYPHLARNLAEFLSSFLLSSTDLVLPPEEKKARVRYFINPELCQISEDLVFAEPYLEKALIPRNRNRISPGNEDFVRRELWQDGELKAQAARLRLSFTNNAQSLLHGDLHSGSVFAGEKGIKIIDPEFAFYGPMGYDIGNIIANLIISLFYSVYIRKDSGEAIGSCISELFELCFSSLEEKYKALVSFPLYRQDSFRRAYLDSVMADSLGFAGTEIIRRCVGDSKTAELSSLPLSETKLSMERGIIKTGKLLIMGRSGIKSGSELIKLTEAQL